MVFSVPSAQFSHDPAFHSNQAERRNLAPYFVWAVWAFCATSVYLFLGRYAFNIPWQDDWALLRMYDKETSIWAWMWSQHNEHRLPVAKAILALIYKLTHHDSRVIMYLNATVLIGLSAALIVVAGRTRGRTVWADAVFPALFLNAAHYGNYLMNLQFCVVCAVALQCLAIVFVHTKAYQGQRGILCFGPVFVLLPLHAGIGMSALPPLLLFLLLASGFRWREATRRSRGDALLLLALAVLSGLLALLYMVGYVSPKWHPSPDSFRHFLRTAAQYLCLSLGLIPVTLWLWALIPTLVLLLATGGLCATALVRARKEGALEAAGYLLCLLSILLNATLVGYGRSGLGEDSGLAHRFVSMVAPLSVLTYLAWDVLPLSARTRAFARNALFSLFVVLMPFNTYQGVRYSEARRIQLQAMLSDLHAGMTPSQLAAKHGKVVYLESEKKLTPLLEYMEKNRLGPYYP